MRSCAPRWRHCPTTPRRIRLGAYIWAELNPLLRTIHATRPDATVVLGGPQISYAPWGEFLIKQYPLASGFIRGYGEVPMSALAVGGAPPSSTACPRRRSPLSRPPCSGLRTRSTRIPPPTCIAQKTHAAHKKNAQSSRVRDAIDARRR